MSEVKFACKDCRLKFDDAVTAAHHSRITNHIISAYFLAPDPPAPAQEEKTMSEVCPNCGCNVNVGCANHVLTAPGGTMNGFHMEVPHRTCLYCFRSTLQRCDSCFEPVCTLHMEKHNHAPATTPELEGTVWTPPTEAPEPEKDALRFREFMERRDEILTIDEHGNIAAPPPPPLDRGECAELIDWATERTEYCNQLAATATSEQDRLWYAAKYHTYRIVTAKLRLAAQHFFSRGSR